MSGRHTSILVTVPTAGGIFVGNGAGNPRNWCPGALVPSHSFPATLQAGHNTVSFAVSPAAVPSGSYYATSLAFTAP